MAKRRLSSAEFVALCQTCGFNVDSEILEAMNKRGLLDSWPNEEYGVPQLFVVALYYEAVQVFRHPWAVSNSDTKLEEVKTANKTVLGLGPDYAIVDANAMDRVVALARLVEGYINRIDPFGPIASVIDFVRDDVRDQLHGVGRRYAELRGFAQALGDAIERVEAFQAQAEQVTLVENTTAGDRPSPAEQTREVPVVDDEMLAEIERETQRQEEDSIASEPTDDVTIDEVPLAPEPISEPVAAIPDDGPDAATVERKPVTADDIAALVEEHDATDEVPIETPMETPVETPAVPPSNDDAGGFSRDQPQYRTARTQDLLSRLKNLKTENSEAEDDEIDAPPADLESQIAELNRQRESLMSNHNWAGLVALYESKIDLFPAKEERQQVFLTLAQIQEIKLKEPSRALQSFFDAIDSGAQPGLERAYSGLLRVGTREENLGTLLDWLEVRMTKADIDERPMLQHAYSSALRESGEKQRAFLSYAAFLTESPETFLTSTSLEGLESFASEVDDTELESFYLDVLEQNEPQHVKATVALGAGKHYLKRNPMLAVKYFRLVLDTNPASTEAYNHLSHLYQEEQNWPDLVELGERRWLAVTESDQEAVAAQMRHVVDQDIEDSDDASDRYKKLVDENPNSIALDWAITAFTRTGRYTEAYAFLNRILERISSMPRRVTVLRTLAEIATNHLSAPEEAVLHYESGLDLAGPRRDLLEGLASIRIQSGSWREAVPLLDQLTGGEVALPEDAQLHWLVKGVQAAEQASLLDALGTFKHRIAAIDTNHELLSR